MMENLFYFIGIFIVYTLFLNVKDVAIYNSTINWTNTFKKVTGKYPTKNELRKEHKYSIFKSFILNRQIQSIWYFIGIATNNWMIFLSMLILNLLFNIVDKNLNNMGVTLILKYIICLICFIASAFLVLNHFHFKIDLL